MVPMLVLLWAIACLAGAAPAAANHRDHLLAPETVCPNQSALLVTPEAAARVMRCMNNYARRQQGRPALRSLASLRWSAERKAEDIRGCGELSHTACGRVTVHWVRRTAFGRDCFRMKENIAYRWPASGTLRLVMSGWLHSPAHRHILMMQRHRWLGIGVDYGPFLGQPEAAVWVAHFGHRC